MSVRTATSSASAPGSRPPSAQPRPRVAGFAGRGDSSTGMKRPRRPLAQPFVHRQSSHLLERVDDGVLVGPPRLNGLPAAGQLPRRPEAFSEIALGGRAQAAPRPARPSRCHVGRAQVRGVHDRGCAGRAPRPARAARPGCSRSGASAGRVLLRLLARCTCSGPGRRRPATTGHGRGHGPDGVPGAPIRTPRPLRAGPPAPPRPRRCRR